MGEFLCDLCFEFMDEPKELPCGHHFCRACLQHHCLDEVTKVKSVTASAEFYCPTCGQLVKIQDPFTPVLDWVDHVPTNVTKQQQLERTTELARQKRRQALRCLFCTAKWKIVLASKYCKACREYYCDECGNQHWLLRATKDHRVWLIDDLQRLKTDSLIQTSLNLLFNAKTKPKRSDRNSASENYAKVVNESEFDEFDADITGIGFLPNSYILLTDRLNERLKLFDKNFVLKDSIKIKCFDLQVLDEKKIVVTCPLEYTFRYIKVDGKKLTEISTFDMNNECFGVCKVKSTSFAMLMMTKPVSIVTVKSSGKYDSVELESGQITMMAPRYIVYIHKSNSYVVSDYIHECIKGISISGSVNWERKLPGCKGVTAFEDNVLVARGDRCSVDLLGDSGQLLKSVIRKDIGLAEVQAICVNTWEVDSGTGHGSMAVSENTNIVRLFRVEDPMNDEDLKAYITPKQPSSLTDNSDSKRDKKSFMCVLL